MTTTVDDLNWLDAWRDRIADDPVAQQAFAFQRRLLQSQAQSPPAFDAMVDGQVPILLRHAARHVPFYRRLFADLDLSRCRPGSSAWASIPILERATLQRFRRDLRAKTLPAGHSVAGTLRSSGSTGTMVEVLATNVTNTWQKAFALRGAIWARRDLSGTLAVLRKLPRPSARLPDGETADHWADLIGFPFATGPRFSLDATSCATHDQFDWLQRRKPDYLMVYPSILNDVVDLAALNPSPWQPRGISTLGETVSDDLRAAVRDVWGLRIDDVYSAEECGTIAIQCPEHGRYHVQSEAVHVEIVGDDDRPCRPGEEGRVLVTTLANMASPLIRYAVGDRAVAGDACPCGRGLPVLERILGRDRNLLVTAHGRFWPSFGTRRFRGLAPIVAQQFRQTGSDRLAVHYVAPSPLSDAQEAALRSAILDALPAPMDIVFRQVAELERGPSGKFEVFVREFQ